MAIGELYVGICTAAFDALAAQPIQCFQCDTVLVDKILGFLLVVAKTCGASNLEFSEG